MQSPKVLIEKMDPGYKICARRSSFSLKRLGSESGSRLGQMSNSLDFFSGIGDGGPLYAESLPPKFLQQLQPEKKNKCEHHLLHV